MLALVLISTFYFIDEVEYGIARIITNDNQHIYMEVDSTIVEGQWLNEDFEVDSIYTAKRQAEIAELLEGLR